MVRGVDIYFGRIISCILARVSCHDWIFSLLKSMTSKVGFFDDQTAAGTKHLEKPDHSAARLWTAFMMFVCVCEFVCVWGPVHCSLVHVHICVCVYMNVHPHILLVFQNLTSLHWTLAVYTGNVPPCPNLPLPARVSHHRTCLALLLATCLALPLCSMDNANKLFMTMNVNSYPGNSSYFD